MNCERDVHLGGDIHGSCPYRLAHSLSFARVSVIEISASQRAFSPAGN